MKRTLLPLKFLESRRCWCKWAVFIFDKIKFLSPWAPLPLPQPASFFCLSLNPPSPITQRRPISQNKENTHLTLWNFLTPKHSRSHSPSFFVSKRHSFCLSLNPLSSLLASPNEEPSAKTKLLPIWNFSVSKRLSLNPPSPLPASPNKDPSAKTKKILHS